MIIYRQEIVNVWQHLGEFVTWELPDKMTQDSIFSAVSFTTFSNDMGKDIDGLLIK